MNEKDFKLLEERILREVEAVPVKDKNGEIRFYKFRYKKQKH